MALGTNQVIRSLLGIMLLGGAFEATDPLKDPGAKKQNEEEQRKTDEPNSYEVQVKYDDGIDHNITRHVYVEDCAKSLLPGQYVCYKLDVDPDTQQPRGCVKEMNVAPKTIHCNALPGLICQETGNSTFFMDAECKWTNGYRFDTALLLSIFLGMFGADRFYLGYPAIGVIKFATFGFFFLGQLFDIVLIASQVLGPADGSHYIINYFGPVLNIIGVDNETVRKPQPDWY